MMLLPKFTIRQLLLGMVGVSVVCMVLGFAARGSVVAHGMGLAVVGLFVPLGVYAAVYWTVLAVSKILPGAHVPEAVERRISQFDLSPYSPTQETTATTSPENSSNQVSSETTPSEYHSS